MYKRWLNVLLSVAMMITLLPTQGLASEQGQGTVSATVPMVQKEIREETRLLRTWIGNIRCHGSVSIYK